MILISVLSLMVIIAVALLYGSINWRAATKDLRAKLEAARLPVSPIIYNTQELSHLPTPVQRYFRAVLNDGQPMIAAVSINHTGTFNLSETAEQWKPFTSTQRVITRRPGFLWEGRIKMMPGLTACVHDAYIAGEGLLHASLFGLVSLVNMRGTPEIAEGELMRFFAEAAWYPTALLPSQGVQWEAVDDASARAILKEGEITVTLLFRFDKNGLIQPVHAEARGRAVAGTIVPTTWEGRWIGYELRDGMRIPLEGEVAWVLPEGPKPYWRGRISSINYEFAR